MADDKEATNFAKSQLRALVERIERLEAEKKALADDIREVYGEAKANGFDVKALRAVVRLRAQDAAERQEFEAVVSLYRDALGLGDFVSSDLGQAAAREGQKKPDVRKAAQQHSKNTKAAGAADRAEASASERDRVRQNQDDAAKDVLAPPRAPDRSVANPPFAHNSPKPGDDMPDIPPGLRREPEMTEPRVAAE
jgi:uncharacterized protein (UPF0335 family)